MKKTATLLIMALIALNINAQTFDTTGLGSWPLLTNSYETWQTGAFDSNRDLGTPTDFGWGNYGIQTHLIEGDSIYILKTNDDEFKAISIDNLASGKFTITLSNLDGSGVTTKTFDRAPYDTKNFFYYAITSDAVKDLEPATANWDIVFRKYLISFPGFGFYPVTGVLHNRDVQTSQVELGQGVTAQINDTLAFPFSSNISTIGYDWKSAGPSGIVTFDTITYLVKNQDGAINELVFTEYGGSGTGKIKFTVNGIADSVVLGAGNVDQVFYSLENTSEVSKNTDLNWDIAFYAQGSFSAIPLRINDINGAELYVYPNTDITYWSTFIGLDESQTVRLVSVFPNPATDQFTLVMHAAQEQDLQLKLFDLNGRLIKSEDLTQTTGLIEYQLKINDLKTGAYILQVAGAGFSNTTKVMIN